MAGATVAGATSAGAANGVITATPHTDLVDGQTIAVHGSGWPAGHHILVSQCHPDAIEACISASATVIASATGSFDHSLVVTRQLGPVDCAAPNISFHCTALALDSDAENPTGENVDLEFVPPPPPPTPTVAVTPHTGLVDGQTVSVTGSDWIPGHTVVFYECSGAIPVCGGYVGQATADSSGDVSASIVVRRVVSVDDRVDCADPARSCDFRAGDLDSTSAAVPVPIAFVPAPPVILPGHGLINEGNSGTRNLTVPVTLSYASSSTVTVHWATDTTPGAPPGIADPATDFTPASGNLTFTPGQTARSFAISVNGDNLVEPGESINVTFTQPTNATVGSFVYFPEIRNDDFAKVLPGAKSVAEGDSGTTNLVVPVTLSNPSTGTITVQWRTGPVSNPPPRADPATDFTAASGVVTFAPGETAKTVTVSVNGDTLVEPDEWILVMFNHPTGATIGGFWGLGFGVVLNDD